MMAPLWRIKVSAVSIEMDEPAALEGKARETFAYWAPLLAAELRYVYAGALFWDKELVFEGGRRPLLRTGKRTAELDESLARLKGMDSGTGLKLSFSDYFDRKGFWVPGQITVNLPSAKLTLRVDRRQVNIPAENALLDPGWK